MIQKKHTNGRWSRWLLFLAACILLLLAACGKTQAVEARPDPAPSLTQESPEDSREFRAEDKTGKKGGRQREGSGQSGEASEVSEDGEYSSKDEVAAYLHLYGHLPSNYITKREAEDLGWDSHAGNLWKVAPGKSIGGNRFGNYEENLPDKNGRKYYECDIDYDGGYRGAKRIIYSSDGLIFYTEDHYETFEQLYDAAGKVG